MQGLNPEVWKVAGDLDVAASTKGGARHVVVRLEDRDGKWQLVKPPCEVGGAVYLCGIRFGTNFYACE